MMGENENLLGKSTSAAPSLTVFWQNLPSHEDIHRSLALSEN
jgi:hypothetical protein